MKGARVQQRRLAWGFCLLGILITGCSGGSDVRASEDRTIDDQPVEGWTAAVVAGADVMGPSARSVPGLGVVLSSPAAIPNRPAGESPDPVKEATFVQEPFLHFVNYDGSEPVEIRLEGAARAVRTPVAVAGRGDEVVAVVDACERAYFTERDAPRPYDCRSELWVASVRAGIAVPVELPDPADPADERIETVALAPTGIRIVRFSRTMELAPDGSWVRLGDGSFGSPARSCALADGSIVRLRSSDEALSLMRGDARGWVDLVSGPHAPNNLNELVCGASVAYVFPFSAGSAVRMERVRADGTVTGIHNPLASKLGPTGWQLDQVTDELVASGVDGSQALLVLAPDSTTPRQTDSTVESFRDATGRVRQFVAAGGAPYTVGDEGQLRLEAFK